MKTVSGSTFTTKSWRTYLAFATTSPQTLRKTGAFLEPQEALGALMSPTDTLMSTLPSGYLPITLWKSL